MGKPKSWMMPGDRVGGLTLLERTAMRVGGSVVGRWRCDCGAECLKTMAFVSLHKNPKQGKRPPIGCNDCSVKHAAIAAAKTNEETHRKIIEAFAESGHEVAPLVKKFGISKQRIHQIVTRYCPPEIVDEFFSKMSREELLKAFMGSVKLSKRRRLYYKMKLAKENGISGN